MNHQSLTINHIISNFLNRYLWFSGFLLLFSLGQLQRIQLTNSVAIYTHEIFAMVWMFKESKRYFSWLKCQFFNTIFFREHSYILFFIFYILLQLVFYNTLNFQFTQIVYYLRFGFYVLFLLFLFFQFKTKKLTSNDFKLSIAFIGLFVAILGLLQYFTIPDSRFLIYSGWDDHYYRLISTFFDPGFTAIILVMIFLALFSWQAKFSKFFFFFVTPLFLLTILLTYSRAGYLSLLVGIFILLATQLRRKTASSGGFNSPSFEPTSLILKWQGLYWKETLSIVLILVFVGLIPFLPKPGGEGVNLLRTASIEQRIESNQTAVRQLTWQTTMFGSGFYRSIHTKESVPNHATAPDNSYIFLFTSLGIVGTIVVALTVYQYKKFVLKNKTLLIAGSALLVNSLFNNSLFYAWNWVVLGMIVLGEEK